MNPEVSILALLLHSTATMLPVETYKNVLSHTPYEAFHGVKPSQKHLKPFGGECYLHIPKAKLPSGSKLLPRAELGVFVGHGAIEYHCKVYTPSNRQLTISADVSSPPPFLGQDKANSANSDTQQTVNSELPTTTDVLGNPQALDVQTTVGSEKSP
ncbi:hypothetical protein K3495_g5962 [Podosphaera aphanis]|nr:hypothetical protein K3495_g5962 [Podosphaera aphanis]